MSTPHELFNPGSLAPPFGFSHAVAAAPGRLVFLGGQTAHGPDGKLRGASLVEQFEAALANLVVALGAAGGRPEHLVSMQVFVTDVAAYRGALKELGDAYRSHLGRHYPAIALLGVSELFDPDARVEIVASAVVPDQ